MTFIASKAGAARDEPLPDWSPPFDKWHKGHAIYLDPELSRTGYLYRYMRADDAFRTLEHKALWFGSPYSWDDPYERWWCELLFQKGHHLEDAKVFGSCWTKNFSHEPFWRLYAPPIVKGLPAVRFRADAATLFNWLGETAQRQGKGKAYMGRVRYWSSSAMRRHASNLVTDTTTISPEAAKCLLLKRKAYVFEDETRLLWVTKDGNAKPGIGFSLVHSDLINQVMIGPTSDSVCVNAVRANLIRLGIDPSRIKNSGIYAVPRAPTLRKP